jgi:hypothetical protein
MFRKEKARRGRRSGGLSKEVPAREEGLPELTTGFSGGGREPAGRRAALAVAL